MSHLIETENEKWDIYINVLDKMAIVEPMVNELGGEESTATGGESDFQFSASYPCGSNSSTCNL